MRIQMIFQEREKEGKQEKEPSNDAMVITLHFFQNNR